MEIQVNMEHVLQKMTMKVAQLESESAFKEAAIDQLSAENEELKKQIDELSKLVPSQEKAGKNGKMESRTPPSPEPISM